MKREPSLPNCVSCGRFTRTTDPGVSHKLVIPSDYWNGPDREVYQCARCTERHGPLRPSSGAADWTAGVNPTPPHTGGTDDLAFDRRRMP